MRRLVVAVAVAVVAASTAQAGFQAYFGPANNSTSGNTDFTGSLGLDFTVGGAAVRVTQLGAFDSFGQQGNGFGTNLISVAIYDRQTQAVVGPVVTFTGTEGTLTNNFRLKDIAPLTLAAGFQGSVVAWSYNSTERAFDSGVSAFPAGWGTNGGGGLIAFTGTGRLGDAGSFPNVVNPSGAANRYGAGTFVFDRADVTAVPAPPAAVLLGVAAGGGLLLRVRRKKAAA